MINKKVVENLNRNNLLSNKQYGFCSARSTANVLTVITHRISEIAENKFIMRALTMYDIGEGADATQILQLWKSLEGFSQLLSPSIQLSS